MGGLGFFVRHGLGPLRVGQRAAERGPLVVGKRDAHVARQKVDLLHQAGEVAFGARRALAAHARSSHAHCAHVPASCVGAFNSGRDGRAGTDLRVEDDGEDRRRSVHDQHLVAQQARQGH